MSRHRNIRKLDYSEGLLLPVSPISSDVLISCASECGYDDVYGRSLEDEVAVSPSTAGAYPSYVVPCTVRILYREIFVG